MEFYASFFTSKKCWMCKVFITKNYAAIVFGYQYLSQALCFNKHLHSKMGLSPCSAHLIDACLHLLPTIC